MKLPLWRDLLFFIIHYSLFIIQFDRQADKQASRQSVKMEDADGQNTITPAVRISLSLLIILLIFIIITPQYN